MTTQLQCFVRQENGGYVTAQLQGQRASCTSSPKTAAERLGGKLFGPSFLYVREVAEGNRFTTKWTIHAEDTDYMSCRADGLIETGSTIPPCNTALASGPRQSLLRLMSDAATRVLGGAGPLRVPGVREQQSAEDRDHLILCFLHQLDAELPRRTRFGVQLEKTIRRAVL